MKKINIIVPCYNEENSIIKLYETIKNIFFTQLKDYKYDIIFVDDYSKDSTRKLIEELCKEDREHVKGAFNASNFGFSRNVFSALQLADGDAAFLVFGDLQDPPDLLPEFVKQWERGYKVVIGQKKASKEKRIMTQMRHLYYNCIDVLSDRKQIRNFNGFGFYDRAFIDILRQIEDIQPFLKQVIAEYASDYAVVGYIQNNSERGKSNFNLYKNYDFAMEGITSSTKKLMRLSTFLGVLLGVFSGIYALSVIIKKLMYWDSYPFGMASLTCGVFMLGAMQLFFIGILGEYILNINAKTLRRPRTVIERKINFEEEDELWVKRSQL